MTDIAPDPVAENLLSALHEGRRAGPTLDPDSLAGVEVRRSQLRAEASLALLACGSTSVELFTPQMVDRMHLDPSTFAVSVLDEDGSVRVGCAPAQLAREIRAAWDTGKNKGKYFK